MPGPNGNVLISVNSVIKTEGNGARAAFNLAALAYSNLRSILP